VVPVFSSELELAKFAGKIDWFSTDGFDVLGLLPPGVLLGLDIASPHRIQLNRAAVRLDHRTRVYGLLVDEPSAVATARDAAAGVIRRRTGGEVAVEAAVPRDDLPPHLARLFDVGVVLWDRDGS
jgi:hypothetical protein